MEYNSGASMILPNSINLIEDDFDNEDNEDIVHEQTNQNEIIELLMAAFEGHDEPSDGDDDDESSNASSSSHSSSDEQQMLNNDDNNDNNNTDEHGSQQQNELRHRNQPHEQVLFSTPVIPSTPSSDVHGFEININDYTRSQYDEHNKDQEEILYDTKNHAVLYQTNNSLSTNISPTDVQYASTIDIIDPLQSQYLHQTSSTNLNDAQNQIKKLHILCMAKDRKVSQLENLCEEYQERYENDTRILKHNLELIERSKYDLEQRYHLINTQREEAIEKNNQLQRTIKDTELRIQQFEASKTQFEKKLSDSESLIDSLHRKVNELQQYESIVRSQNDNELLLSTIREKHEQEIIFLNEKLQNIQMNLQEKNIEVDQLRVQLEIAHKNNEKTLIERMETINHLNEQLYDYQRKYMDLSTTTSLETFNQIETKRQLTRMTEDKEKLELKCQELQSEIRTLRERLNKNEHEVNNAIFSIKSNPIIDYDNNQKSILNESIVNENVRLKKRIDEYALNETYLTKLNEDLQNKIYEYENKDRRSDSNSSSSSDETVITTNVRMEQMQNLTSQNERLQKDLAELEEKYEYEKHELQTMLEQLREDVIDLDKTKQLYIDVCHEKNTIEDTLRTKFEFELKTKIDDLYQILEQEYNEKLSFYKTNYEKIERDYQLLKEKQQQSKDQQLKDLYEEIDKLKVKHERKIIELNNELDTLKMNDDAKTRLEYTEKEFEQLKHDYYDLNIKQKELLRTCSTLESENENLLKSIEKTQQEKIQLEKNFKIEEEKLLNQIKQLNELNDHQNYQSKENFSSDEEKLLNQIKQLNESNEHEKLQLKENFKIEQEKLLNQIQHLNESNENEKLQLKENFKIEKEKLLNQIKQLNEVNEHQNYQLKENFPTDEEKLLNQIKQLNEANEHEKLQLKENFKIEEDTLLNQIKQLNESNEHEKLQLKQNFKIEEEKLLNQIQHLNESNENEKLQLKQNFKIEGDKLLNQIQHLKESNEHENLQLKQNFKIEQDKLLKQIKQLNELNEHQKQELLSLHKKNNHNQSNLKQDVESLQLRINNYEDAITQYEEYRVKFEQNLQKLTQQRDTYKVDLRLTKELLTSKEDEYNHLKLRFDECEKDLQTSKERSIKYETTINDLQRQFQQYELQIQELNQTQSTINQETEREYREKLISLDGEKRQLEQRLQVANRALDLADSHLQQEIEKIKLSLEQEYNRLYERDHKQHQQDLHQLRNQLTNEIEKQRIVISPVNLPNSSHQDIEEVKKVYRTEIDRLYHENIELSQHQTKLIDNHQKQMQIMKKELDDGYNNIINEFQREQIRLQTRCDQLKQQLTDEQQTIEQLRSNLNHLKINRFDDKTKTKDIYTNENYTIEQNQRNRQDNLQIRLEKLVKLLEQSNDALHHERTLHTKRENDYQQNISSLQKRIADMVKQHTKAMDETKRELHNERIVNQKNPPIRPMSVPEFTKADLSSTNIKSDNTTSTEKLRELFTNEMIALLRLTCKMIFDVHHRVTTAQYIVNLETSIKKQIQNELIRSRNSMIKEIRREIFEKLTHALRSQRVPDTTIDMHIFELDHLLSQMAQNRLDSLTTSSPSSSNSSILSFQITPQRQHNRSIIYDSSSSLPNKSTPSLRKSIECLYITPTVNRQSTPISSYYCPTFDDDRRPKSASNILLASQNSPISPILSSHTHKFQRSNYKNSQMKMHRSEDDIMLAIQRNEQQKFYLNNNNNNNNTDEDDDDEDTLTLCENEKEHQQSNVRTLAKQFEQKTNLSTNYSRNKSRTSDIHYTIARTTTTINNQQEKIDDIDDDELTWPQQSLSNIPSTQTSGIKNFVRNRLKLFVTQSHQQQHKRTGK